MTRRKYTILSSFLPLLLLLIGLSAVRLWAAPSGTITVDTLVDENDGSCGDGDCSLRDAIETAVANDLIIFDNGLSGGTIDVSPLGQLTIDKHLTISGTVPITISGGNSVRVFLVGPLVQLNFFSLTIADGNSMGLECMNLGPPFNCGSGMFIRPDSVVNLREVVVKNNTVITGGGAGIWVSYSQLNIEDSTFMSNTADWGGGITASGDATVSVKDSAFLGNAVTGSGGAISMGNAGPLTVTYSVFANNSADAGGAIDGAAFTEINIGFSTFRDNTADYGGAIQVGVTDSYLTIQNSAFYGNVAANAGGAISTAAGGKFSLVNSTISGNMALGSDPGIDGGGGIHLSLYLGIYGITNTTIVNNSAPNVAGRDGLWQFEGDLTIRNSIVAGNGSSNCTIDSGGFDADDTNISDDATCTDFLMADPQLDPLADNGGGTLTHALQPASPAIDAGNNDICPAMDQRGVARPVDGDGDSVAVCDIGAFEFTEYIVFNYLPAVFRP